MIKNMPKKKIKTKTILLKLNEEDYNKIILQAGEYKTFTQVIEENIRGGYFSKFKTNELIDTSIKSNKELVSEIKKQEIKHEENQESLEDLKAQFIARRKAKKEGDNHD